MRDFDEQLLAAIKKRQETLEAKLKDVDSHWIGEDFIYRFYHGSFKVYSLQCITKDIMDIFREIAEELSVYFKSGDDPKPIKLNGQLEKIVNEGTGKKWELEHNQRWDEETRPIVEAFFHARYFLQMMVKYGRELDKAPQCLPSGWASVLYLYRAR
jgi:hypothetical protein